MTDSNAIDLRERRRQEMSEASFATNAQGGAVMLPRNGKELMDFANLMSSSGAMVRDFYRGNPGDCAALIMICQPYGFNPFLVSWKTYKASKNADAPISFEGQLVNAMVNMSAPVKGRLKYEYEGEDAERTCTVIGIERETGAALTYTSPPIGKIAVKNSPLWKSDPDQQLAYFSARAWARRHFPELLLGIYARDELDEQGIRDITPKESPTERLKRITQQSAGEAAGSASDDPAPDDTEEAEIAPTEAEDGGAEAELPLPPGEDVANAYMAGQQAWIENFPDRDDCPHKDGPLRDAWLEGYDKAAE